MIGGGFRVFDLPTFLPYSFVHSFGQFLFIFFNNLGNVLNTGYWWRHREEIK